jgi:hypothetical protein
MAVIGALDSEPPPEFRVQAANNGQAGGYSSMLSASAAYARTRRRTQVFGSAFSAFRYYQQLDRAAIPSHSGALGATVRLPKRAEVQVNQTAAYSPSFLFGAFSDIGPTPIGEAIPPAADYRVSDQRSHSYATRFTLAAGSIRGNRASFSAERSSTNFQQPATSQPNLNVLTVATRWSHGFGRTGVLSAEYERRTGEFGYGARTTEQRLRVGAEYSPARSVSRRITLRFNLAPSALETPGAPSTIGYTGTLYRVEGDVSAEYPFLRNWSLNGGYRRGVDYIPLLREPILRSATRVALSGTVNRRIDLSASAAYMVGQTALTRESPTFDTYSGTARGRFVATRSIALYAEYLYYHYDLGAQVWLAPNLPPKFEQQGIRMGIELWTRPLGR